MEEIDLIDEIDPNRKHIMKVNVKCSKKHSSYKYEIYPEKRPASWKMVNPRTGTRSSKPLEAVAPVVITIFHKKEKTLQLIPTNGVFQLNGTYDVFVTGKDGNNDDFRPSQNIEDIQRILFEITEEGKDYKEY